MTGFWTLSDNSKPTGDEASSFASNFAHLPDNTTADAVISSFEPRAYNEEQQYSVVWTLSNGEFAGVMVRQTIAPFSQEPRKSDRAKNMMKRLYDLCAIMPKHNNPPVEADLLPFVGKKCSIKIGNGVIEGKEKTFVREVHAAGKLEASTGHTEVKMGYPSAVESAFSRNAQPLIDDLQSDVPF